jgi:hypothetical protein
MKRSAGSAVSRYLWCGTSSGQRPLK